MNSPARSLPRARSQYRRCSINGCNRPAAPGDPLCHEDRAQAEALLRRQLERQLRPTLTLWADRITRALFWFIGACLLVLLVRNLPWWRGEVWWP